MAQYLKPDTELGYIEDQAEIEKLKIDNIRHTILGCMLGDFDETGSYIVDPEIVQELIEMPKYVVETMDNIEICKGVLKLDKQISFAVTFEGNKATLSLIEKLNYEANFAINSGTYSNINEYVLDTVETSGEINRNAIYLRWNIADNSGNVLDIFNCDEELLEKYFGLVNRFKYLLQANKQLLEKEKQIEEIEAAYANELLEVLKHYPELYSAVMKQIEQTLKEKPGAISVENPNFAKTFNELLDNVVQSNLSVLDEKAQAEFEAEKRNVLVNLNVRRAEIFEFENVSPFDAFNNDLNSKVLRMKVDDSYQSKTVGELAQEFLAVHKSFISTSIDLNSELSPEISKLIETLLKQGFEEYIKKPTNKVALGTMISEVAEKVKTAQKKEEAKKAAAKKAAAKKAAAKKAAAKKKAAGKKAGGAKKAGGGKDAKKAGGGNNKEEEKKRVRLLTLTSQRIQDEEKPIVANKLTDQELFAMEANLKREVNIKAVVGAKRNNTSAVEGNINPKDVLNNPQATPENILANNNTNKIPQKTGAEGVKTNKPKIPQTNTLGKDEINANEAENDLIV